MSLTAEAQLYPELPTSLNAPEVLRRKPGAGRRVFYWLSRLQVRVEAGIKRRCASVYSERQRN